MFKNNNKKRKYEDLYEDLNKTNIKIKYLEREKKNN